LKCSASASGATPASASEPSHASSSGRGHFAIDSSSKFHAAIANADGSMVSAKLFAFVSIFFFEVWKRNPNGDEEACGEVSGADAKDLHADFLLRREYRFLARQRSSSTATPRSSSSSSQPQPPARSRRRPCARWRRKSPASSCRQRAGRRWILTWMRGGGGRASVSQRPRRGPRSTRACPHSFRNGTRRRRRRRRRRWPSPSGTACTTCFAFSERGRETPFQ